jgi:hypothetical protein
VLEKEWGAELLSGKPLPALKETRNVPPGCAGGRVGAMLRSPTLGSRRGPESGSNQEVV